MSFVRVVDEYKRYQMGDSTIVANNGVSFEIEQGEFAVILGPSGAGKSTVLNILGGMDQPDEGEVWVDGKNIATYTTRQLTEYRRDEIGFVFQFYNLVPNLTARENLELATQISPDALDIDDVLDGVGLTHRRDNFPAQLSGGEQQRVAIARALAKNPKLLLCDEPTGALDLETGKQILRLLQQTAHETKTTVIVITHNSSIASMADRVVYIHDAKVREIVENPRPRSVDEIEW
ncbi:MAG TPA: ABC transporter ATP-binding protein [Bacilli bacterium]|nr:ABC transporter ATP-binding protein [Bacilli bacterium]